MFSPTDLERENTTTMQLKDKDGGPLIDSTGEEQIVLITGYQKYSSEYEAARVKIMGTPKTSVQLHKDGTQHLEFKGDPKQREKNIHLCASVVTDVQGFTGWEATPANILALFMGAKTEWIAVQWAEHLERDERDFLARRKDQETDVVST